MALSPDELDLESTELLPERELMTSFTLPTVSTAEAPTGSGPLGPVTGLKDSLLGGLGKGGGSSPLPVGGLKDSVLGLPKQELLRHLGK